MLTLERLMIRQDAFELVADWSAPAPGIVALIGPSGAGKSTLLSVIGGFFAPTQGRVLWHGDDITTRHPGDRPVATLFQDNNLFPHLTVAQNLGLALTPSLRLSGGQIERIDAALAQVGLVGMGPRKPGALSGGQQSRAALARVLLQDRPILLLDESFSALGPALKSEMLDLVATALQDKLVLMVTHDPADAQRIAGAVSLVADGVAVTPVPTAALFANPPQALRRYLGPVS